MDPLGNGWVGLGYLSTTFSLALDVVPSLTRTQLQFPISSLGINVSLPAHR